MVKPAENSYLKFMRNNPELFPWGSDENDNEDRSRSPPCLVPRDSETREPEMLEDGRIFYMLPSCRLLAGKVLQHCESVIKKLRMQTGGLELVIFKIGITHECSRRFELYKENGWDRMVVMHQSDELGAMEMLATAKHVVSVAKTFAREDDCKALQEMAACPDGDAEKALQRILKKYDLTLNVPRTNLTCAPNCTVPVLLPEDYIRLLSEKGYLHKLLGGPLESSRPRLREFWKQYKIWEPEHEVWMHEHFDPETTVPLLVHGDGGRTYRKEELMVVQFQPVLGWGSRTSHPVHRPGVAGVNLQKHSFTTRFLYGVLQKAMYKDNDDCFMNFLDGMMQNLAKLYNEGLDLHGGQRLRFLLLGVKGTEDYHFEDFATAPAWLQTTGPRNPYPWSRIPPFLEYMPHIREDAPSFFRLDIMHLLHLGFGRDFCGSSLVLLLDLYNADSITVALESQTADLKLFLKQTRRQLHFKRLSRDMLGYKNEHSFPTGHWSKALDTPVMFEFVKWLLDQQQGLLQEDQLLRLIYGASHAMGVFMRTVLKAGLWLTKQEAAIAAEAGLFFLQAYGKCARICADRNLCRYNLTPKLHFWHHLCLRLHQGVQKDLLFLQNPLADSNFADEDFVGRIARLSRRVSPRMQSERTIGRYLVATRGQLRAG
ncbi:hypothetical protein AK812_SmicGene39428 [Symbiodinium microadriaticum]|uniref:Uncharacterized protein n=1 Tax=Symbiodinium microadriaticum TaxID=2951 RepID=A0A1Q9CB86_SYMMI|nr:hypothetical protein AK812_SmicGene39428 [Symbiodinium microadriaticum]